MVKPAARRSASKHLRESYDISGRRAARVVCLHRSTMRYEPSRRDSEGLRRRLVELATEYPRYGYRMLTDKLHQEGERVNHKRVYRLYREQSLQLPKRRRKRIRSAKRAPLQPATRVNQRWSMDFVHDMLGDRRRFRALAVLDNCSRESLAIEVASSIPGARVVRVLGEIASERGIPDEIVIDNGPEFRGRELDRWATQNGVRLAFIQPGKPTQNAFIESFNATFRDECLNANWFVDFEDARFKVEQWRREYNELRPHSSIGRMPPTSFAGRAEAFVKVSVGQ
jgi:putative transposase